MLETIFGDTKVQCLATSPFAAELESFATRLSNQRYGRNTIRIYVTICDCFGRWLSKRKVSIAQTDRKMIERYLKSRTKGMRSNSLAAINAFVRHLRSTSRVPLENVQPTEIDRWLISFREYLEHVLGAAASTQRKYLFFAERLLKLITQSGTIDWTALNAELIIEFVRGDVAPRTGQGSAPTTAGVRSFLRFLVSLRLVPAGLVAAVPSIKRWRHGALPRHLNESEISQLLSLCPSSSVLGRRNHAILLLLSRLGLRADEVANLELSDVDWVKGSILIRSKKTRCEREVPLMQDVAEALIWYLQNGRTVTNCRRLFVQHCAPFGPLQSTAITKIVIRLATKAGIHGRSRGAHLFRHTVATRMVNSGVSFKDVADILGHQSLTTTSIYAKLNVQTLVQVALPWPGEQQ